VGVFLVGTVEEDMREVMKAKNKWLRKDEEKVEGALFFHSNIPRPYTKGSTCWNKELNLSMIVLVSFIN
jgi:hypothetical protein